MDDVAVLQLHERLGPSVYEEHSLHDRERFDAHSFRPKYGAEPPQSLSTIFRRSRHRDHRSTAGPLPLTEVRFPGEPSRFLTDNFGPHNGHYGPAPSTPPPQKTE